MSGEGPVIRVFHDIEDGAWQFHGPEESDPKDMAYVCLHHVIDKDAPLATCMIYLLDGALGEKMLRRRGPVN